MAPWSRILKRGVPKVIGEKLFTGASGDN